ncbi:hypothetical protein RND81_02G184800 [Saponaria officinalis]|uniref:DUF7054 domain-containing protein n=1 Tax=Saponaria officinalis TaxID=3572 RepID=A0AAW1MMM9_SAPOF
MLLSKHKKGQNSVKGKNRILITVNVLGSAGPLRFVVNDDEVVASIIDMALKSYAREGRLPVLGSNFNDFLLYCPLSGSDAINPFDTIGAHGARNFLLCKRPQPEKALDVETEAAGIARKGSGSWKTWINKTLSLKIASH